MQVRGDDYGEFINLEDFDVSGLKDENKENIDLQIPYDDEDMMGEEEVAVTYSWNSYDLYYFNWIFYLLVYLI